MAAAALATPCVCARAQPVLGPRSRTLLVVARGQNTASPAVQCRSEGVERLQRLPRISFSYDRSQLDATELADLLSQVACFAPGQSFHQHPLGSGSGSSSSVVLQRVDPARLRGALRHSLVCVAAFTEERNLPPQLHLEARGLGPAQQQQQPQDQRQQQQQQQAAGRSLAPPAWPPGPPRMRRSKRVLVGFARAVGDASLVATVHDVAVLPELQGLGLGRQLLERLTRQLDMLGIIDIGLLAPDDVRGFFSGCSFGRDTENSIVMTLSQDGVSTRAGLPVEGMAVHVR